MKEVAFHTSARGPHVVGEPVAVRPAGMFVSGADMRLWIAMEVEPPGFDSIDPGLAADWRSIVEEARTMGDSDDALAMAACIARYPRAPADARPQMIANVRERRAHYEDNGFDLCWGEGDRETFGIARIDEDDEAKIMESIVDYRAALTAQERTDMERAGRKMAMRNKVLPKSALKPRT